MNKLDRKIVSKEKYANIFSEFINLRESKLITFVNPYSYYKVLGFESFENIDYVFSDGSLHTYLHRLFCWSKGRFLRASFDFSSLATQVFSFASEHKLKVAIIGGSEDEINQACTNIHNLFPSLDIVFCVSGFFSSEKEMESIACEISNSDIVIVGMGTTLQEKFSCIVKNQENSRCLIFTCGGFITQTAKKPDYYHKLVKVTGLRWLQRALDCSHVRRRLINDYPRFFFKYIIEHIFYRG